MLDFNVGQLHLRHLTAKVLKLLKRLTPFEIQLIICLFGGWTLFVQPFTAFLILSYFPGQQRWMKEREVRICLSRSSSFRMNFEFEDQLILDSVVWLL